MNRPPVSAIAVAAFAIGLVPVLVMLGLDGMPSLGNMRAQKTADIVGVWVMTWGLILLGVAAAVTVSWLAWSADTAARQLDSSSSLGESGSTPGASNHRSVA